MRFKPYSAFGWVVFTAAADAGEQRVLQLGEQGRHPGYYFMLKGRSTNIDAATGARYPDRVAGMLNREAGQVAAEPIALQVTFTEDTEWLCIPEMHNQGRLPDVASLMLPAGTQHAAEQGANLFLAKGEVAVADKRLVGPCQIRVRSGAATIVAVTDSYLLEFR